MTVSIAAGSGLWSMYSCIGRAGSGMALACVVVTMCFSGHRNASNLVVVCCSFGLHEEIDLL